ncbi:MAG: CDP-glycerol glycerophosphotransferase family protein [Propionibacteriales bacterium]|nr:CDP-glycerol glycerophosphotransferase family protein [Propionibacteriales bacterium]
MAYDRVRAQQSLIRLAKSGPGRVRGPVGRATRRFRNDFSGIRVSVVLPLSDDETTRIGPCLDTLRAQSHRNLDIIVVPYGRHDTVLGIARRHAAEDWRIRVRSRVEPTLAAARNAGVDAARGGLVLVASGGDDFLPRGIARLVSAHEESGSALVVGRMKEPETVGWVPDSPFDAAHRVDAARTTLAASPFAITDLGLGNKAFTPSLWRQSGLRFTDGLRTGADVAVGLLHHAGSFDLLQEPTYVPTARRDGVGVGTMHDVLSGLDTWIDQHERTWTAVTALDRPDVRAWWLWGVLDAAVQPLLADVERADERQWKTLREHVSMLLESAGDNVWSTLSSESRIQLWLLQHGHRDQLEEFAADRLFAAGSRPTIVRDGRIFAQYPFHDDVDLAIPAELFELSEEETRLRVVLRDVRWTDGERIEIRGSAAIDFVTMTAPPTIVCTLVDPASGARVELDVEQYRDRRANQGTGSGLRRHQDASWGGFVAGVPVADLVGTGAASWELEVSLATDGVTRSGPVNEIEVHGSADYLGRQYLAPRPVAGAVVGFSPRGAVFGLRIEPDAGPRLQAVEILDRTVTLTLDPTGPRVAAVRAGVGNRQVRGEATAGADGTTTFRFDLPAPWTGQNRWSLTAIATDGVEHPIGWPAVQDQWLGVGAGELVLARTDDGATEVWEAGATLVVDDVLVDDLDVTLTGRWLAAEAPGDVRIELVSRKASLPGRIEAPDSGGAVVVRFRLVVDPWGLGESPAPGGIYAARVFSGGRSAILPLGERALANLNQFVVSEHHSSRVLNFGLDCNLELQRPIAEDERGSAAQIELQQWYAAADFPLEENSVYLQSYVGASATDSQLAIHRELRRTRPDLTIYWGVAGSSSWVPEGGIAVTMNSREWYRVMASAKYLCMNIDPERWFHRRPGQKLLQTFHGYPAKSMGLRMWRAKHYTQKRIESELARTSGEWDLILTPAPAMDEHYRREYAYDGPIHSHGYPRDDELVNDGADALREDTRRRLGIRPGQKAVLYAPTWRDDLATNWRTAELVQHLDLEAASRALGPDYVLLMRGHRFHSAASSPLNDATARFLDVTDYPEINHLILAADAAVLDYSSLRFDFALTQRPMIFLVPDLDTYVGGVRGFLYDYRDSAPGPLVDTADEAVRLLRDFGALERAVAPEMARFHEKYNQLQDGRSAELVVAEFFA